VEISVTRSGGFAGLTRRASVDTDRLPDAEHWQAVLGRIGLAGLPASRPRPDRFVYTIEIDGQVARIGEADMTGALRELVDMVMEQEQDR
jgi:hypothetical protein